MKNPKARQPDPVSGTVAHEGVNKPMNDPMGTDSKASTGLDTDKLDDNSDSANTAKDGSVLDTVTDILTDTDTIEPDEMGIDTSTLEDGYQTDIRDDDLTEGLTPKHFHNIDESRIDEVLVEDSLDEDHYPTIQDIADDDAVAHSHEDDL